jgi:hypothetical protein
MAGNRIFRGLCDEFYTVSKPVAGAYLPGTFVEETATQLAAITTAIAKRPLVLMNLEFTDQDLSTAYTTGDTGLAIELRQGMRIQARVAAASYALNAPLTIGASSRLTAATTGTRVVAYFRDTAGAYNAGDLADVEIADGYKA